MATFSSLETGGFILSQKTWSSLRAAGPIRPSGPEAALGFFSISYSLYGVDNQAGIEYCGVRHLMMVW